MKRIQTPVYTLVGGLTFGVALAVASQASAQQTTVAKLTAETHFHGIAAHPSDPERFFLATHHGLFVVTAAGKADRVANSRDDFMGFTPHPTEPLTFYASGHPARGGNLGFIASMNAGITWSKLSDGVDGPVDFHHMDVSAADPKVIYGVHNDAVQRSDDGGRSWKKVGPTPQGLIGLATSSLDPSTLYAATQRGLAKSSDGGRTWSRMYATAQPATMVHAARDDIYAFVLGTGLMRASELELRWEVVGGGFGGSYLLHLAVDRKDGQRMYTVAVDPRTKATSVLASHDGGQQWSTVRGE